MTSIGHHPLGTGPEKVIVMHGWFSDYTVYEPLFPWLDTTTFTFAFMDFRGYGKSKSMEGAHTIEEMGRDALALAESLGWDRFHAVGHSMAGKVVQWMAAEAPEKVKSIVGITPVPAIAIPFDPESRALFEGAWEKQENRGTILSMTTGDRLGELWRDSMTEKSFATSQPKAFRDYFLAWADETFAERVQGNETPFKVIVGRHDAAITEETMVNTVMQWFPKAEMEVFEDAGHYPMVESPPHLGVALNTFLSKAAERW